MPDENTVLAAFFLNSPWALSALAAVAAVAILTLYRPARRMVVVGSLSLWRQAAGSVSSAARRPRWHISAAWCCLLAGAIMAVAALSGPVYRSAGPTRRIAVEVYPSAELAGGEDVLLEAVRTLLERMDDTDRVHLSLPTALQAPTGPLSPAEAIQFCREDLAVLPLTFEELTVPETPEVDRTYRFVPAGADVAEGPDVTVIKTPTQLPPVTIEAVGSEILPGEKVQTFAAVKNRTEQKARATVTIRAVTNAEGRSAVLLQRQISVEPGQRNVLVETLDAHPAYTITLNGEGPKSPGAFAAVARSSTVTRGAAIIGRDNPLLRRFVNASPTLESVADAESADVVIADSADSPPPPGKPALVINPQSPPPGCRLGEQLEHVVLEDVSSPPDEAVMAHVDLAGAAFRRLRPWILPDRNNYAKLAEIPQGALIIRNEPAAAGEPKTAKRIYAAFDVAPRNTNFALTESFVIFMANATDWLAPGGRRRHYDFTTPREAGPQAGMRAIISTDPTGKADGALPPWPGLYRRGDDELVAVNMFGLSGGDAKTPPQQQAAAAPLPKPVVTGGRRLDLWPILAAAALVLWLAGWCLRIR